MKNYPAVYYYWLIIATPSLIRVGVHFHTAQDDSLFVLELQHAIHFINQKQIYPYHAVYSNLLSFLLNFDY